MSTNAEKIDDMLALIPAPYHDTLRAIAESLGDDLVFMEPSMLSSGECSVFLYRQKALSMKITKNVSYITCNSSLLKQPDLITSSFKVYENTDQVRLNMDMTFDHEAFMDAFTQISRFLRKFPSVERFGCCHRFIQCSDARRCLIYDSFEALGCYYRENLEAGRIFYGVNANV